MKNKIKRLSKEIFIFHSRRLFSRRRGSSCVSEKADVQRKLFSQNQGRGDDPWTGFIHRLFRVRCEEQGFDGNPVNISYTYDGSGLVPGHVEHGKFTIVCNGGEYEVALLPLLKKPFVMTTYGKVQSLEDFKSCLFGIRRRQKSCSVPEIFYEILKYEDKRIQALYDNMRKWGAGSAGVGRVFWWAASRKRRFF